MRAFRLLLAGLLLVGTPAWAAPRAAVDRAAVERAVHAETTLPGKEHVLGDSAAIALAPELTARGVVPDVEVYQVKNHDDSLLGKAKLLLKGTNHRVAFAAGEGVEGAPTAEALGSRRGSTDSFAHFPELHYRWGEAQKSPLSKFVLVSNIVGYGGIAAATATANPHLIALAVGIDFVGDIAEKAAMGAVVLKQRPLMRDQRTALGAAVALLDQASHENRQVGLTELYSAYKAKFGQIPGRKEGERFDIFTFRDLLEREYRRMAAK